MDDIAEFDNGKVVYRKDAGVMNKRLQFVFSQYKEKFDSIDDIGYFSALQIKQIITSKDRPSHISLLEFWKQRVNEFREEGRESYAKMNEETVRIFTIAEGDVPIPALNTFMIEHFKKWMAKKGYANGNIGLRLTHLKARINELIKAGVLKQDIHPFAYIKIAVITIPIHSEAKAIINRYINKIDLNKGLIRHPASSFYGRVLGNSMSGEGINEGDRLIIDKSLK